MSEQLKEKDTSALTASTDETPETERTVKDKNPRRTRYIALSAVFGLFFVLGVTLIAISIWYKNNYFLEFKELLYVLTGPLEGTGGSMISDILWATVPYASVALILYVTAVIILANKKKLIKKAVVLKWIRIGGSLLCS